MRCITWMTLACAICSGELITQVGSDSTGPSTAASGSNELTDRQRLRQKVMRRLLSRFDKNGDGKLDRTERQLARRRVDELLNFHRDLIHQERYGDTAEIAEVRKRRDQQRNESDGLSGVVKALDANRDGKIDDRESMVIRDILGLPDPPPLKPIEMSNSNELAPTASDESKSKKPNSKGSTERRRPVSPKRGKIPEQTSEEAGTDLAGVTGIGGGDGMVSRIRDKAKSIVTANTCSIGSTRMVMANSVPPNEWRFATLFLKLSRINIEMGCLGYFNHLTIIEMASLIDKRLLEFLKS